LEREFEKTNRMSRSGGILLADQLVFLPVVAVKFALGFDDDPIFEGEVWGVGSGLYGLNVSELYLFVADLDAGLVDLRPYALLQTTAVAFNEAPSVGAREPRFTNWWHA
jgi:hypothetical protein